jgi:hypothetical protein
MDQAERKRSCDICQIAQLFQTTFWRAGTAHNSEKGFKRMTMCPFEPNILLEEEFLLRKQHIDVIPQTFIETILMGYEVTYGKAK